MSSRPRLRSIQPGGFFLSAACLLPVAFLALFALAPAGRGQEKDAAGTQTPGALAAVDPSGKQRGFCPLRHTDVRADIAGFLARVNVTQEFENPFPQKIEAVYTFPLPQSAAVDDMTLKVGDRVVKGKILRREEARAVYEAARQGGQVAGLLDQERPNIFTQSVANIAPGERVTVALSYVETLKYDGGTYEFSFPTVVGPRYVPGAPTGAPPQGGGRLSDTDRVPDGSRISPRVMPEGMRAGHDISIDVALDAGLPVGELKSVSHEIEIERPSPTAARVRLKDSAAIPNKDFVLRYDVAGRKIEDALLTHRDSRGGYFTLILQPPERVTVEDVSPKELVFVLDTSGSMSGFPIEKAKETMRLALEGLNPQDTFNLITFSGDTAILFPQPVPATKENLARALKFLEWHVGEGGTEMMKAVRAALDPSDSADHVRVVCFMTDGYVGNDMEIISEVQKHPNARVFAFGIGGAVNRFLLDQMAERGRGEVEYVSLRDDGSAAARRFHERVRNPLLTDITVDWGGLPVADVYPRRVPDLFSARPVVLTGRFTRAGRGVVRIRGRMSGHVYEREIAVNLPDSQPEHDELATLWARRRVDELMGEDYAGLQRGSVREDLREAITGLGLEYRLMTQFTSFVAVEEMTVNEGGQPRRIDVPVELPEGVSPKAVGDFGLIGFNGGVSGVGYQFSAGRMSANVGYLMPNSPPTVTMSVKVEPEKAGAAQSSAGTARPSAGATQQNPANTKSANVGELMDSVEVMRIEGNLSPEQQKELALRAKLDPWLFAAAERLEQKGSQPSAEEARFVRDGKAEVQIWLTEKSPEVLAQLKQLGFEVLLDPQTAKLVIGRLPVEKLAALADIKAVRYVAPQR
ncbi:MAG: VIT and VWA domain-containing protein [Acidobacteriota bacterium]|nr:VIT and VWA domain-containing protein [Acidobacteriota bacterium]